MKKISVLLIMWFSITLVKANPITCPPAISEFYLIDNSHWFLELVFVKNGCYKPTTLDGCKIATSTGIVAFKNGITITPDSILVLTQDNLSAPLEINRAGDFISISNSSGTQMTTLRFGLISNSFISAPKQGQSIVNYLTGCWRQLESKFDIQYHTVKENHPTIGRLAFSLFNTSLGTFTGIIYDKAHHPVPGIHVGNSFYYIPVNVCENFFKSTITDADGKFSIPQYSGNYPVSVFFDPLRVLCSSFVTIEPDSTTYYECEIDTTVSSIDKIVPEENINLTAFPNPSGGEITLSFAFSSNKKYANAVINVFSAAGELICSLPVIIANSQKRYAVKWDGLHLNKPVSAGIYYCSLELDGQKVATTKISIVK